jgi:Ni/Co efflux regulator RcnB
MRRLILATLATTMLAVSALEGQAAPLNAPVAPQSGVVQVDWKKPAYKSGHKHGPQWRHGQRYSDWRRHKAIRNYRHYHLRRPAAGQEWIRVGNDYLLVGIATGIIASIVAAH